MRLAWTLLNDAFRCANLSSDQFGSDVPTSAVIRLSFPNNLTHNDDCLIWAKCSKLKWPFTVNGCKQFICSRFRFRFIASTSDSMQMYSMRSDSFEPQVSYVPWRLRTVWPWDVCFLLWNWVAVSLGPGNWWRWLGRSNQNFTLGPRFLLVCFSCFSISLLWMPCPKFFAISPRIYCSFYWFYWVPRYLLHALTGSSCAVSLVFISFRICDRCLVKVISMLCLDFFHFISLPDRKARCFCRHLVCLPDFDSKIFPTQKKAIVCEPQRVGCMHWGSNPKMKWHQIKPDLTVYCNHL